LDDCLKETSSVPFSPFSDSAHSTWVSATERVRTGKRWKDSAAERVEITIPVYHYLLLKNETPRRRSIRRSRNGQAIYTVGSIFRAVRPVYTLRLSSRRIGYLTREREREQNVVSRVARWQSRIIRPRHITYTAAESAIYIYCMRAVYPSS